MHLKLGGPTCPFSEEKERKKKKETKNTATGNPLVFALKSRYQFLDSKACRLLCFLVFFTALKGEKSSDVFPGAEASSLFVFFFLMLPSSGVAVLDLVFFFNFSLLFRSGASLHFPSFGVMMLTVRAPIKMHEGLSVSVHECDLVAARQRQQLLHRAS